MRVRGVLFAVALCSAGAAMSQTGLPPGLQRYSPTRIDWLALWANAQVRHPYAVEEPYDLSVTNVDHETVAVVVFYGPQVNREAMNIAIESAHKVILMTAKGYGWSSWVKVQERIEPAGTLRTK
jgi:hypothetical protein